MVSQDLEAVIHAEGEHIAVVGGHRVVIAAVGTVLQMSDKVPSL